MIPPRSGQDTFPAASVESTWTACRYSKPGRQRQNRSRTVAEIRWKGVVIVADDRSARSVDCLNLGAAAHGTEYDLQYCFLRPESRDEAGYQRCSYDYRFHPPVSPFCITIQSDLIATHDTHLPR